MKPPSLFASCCQQDDWYVFGRNEFGQLGLGHRNTQLTLALLHPEHLFGISVSCLPVFYFNWESFCLFFYSFDWDRVRIEGCGSIHIQHTGKLNKVKYCEQCLSVGAGNKFYTNKCHLFIPSPLILSLTLSLSLSLYRNTT